MKFEDTFSSLQRAVAKTLSGVDRDALTRFAIGYQQEAYYLHITTDHAHPDLVRLDAIDVPMPFPDEPPATWLEEEGLDAEDGLDEWADTWRPLRDAICIAGASLVATQIALQYPKATVRCCDDIDDLREGEGLSTTPRVAIDEVPLDDSEAAAFLSRWFRTGTLGDQVRHLSGLPIGSRQHRALVQSIWPN